MATTEFRDYYAILELHRSAKPEQIKAAYRRLARQHHPDLNPGDGAAEARFKDVSEAYRVLADPDQRRHYDHFGLIPKASAGPADPSSQPMRQPPARPSSFEQVEFGGYDTFEEFLQTWLGRFDGARPVGQRSYPRPDNSAGIGGFEVFRERQSRAAQPPPSVMPVEMTLALSLAEAFHGVQRRLYLSNGEVLDVPVPAGVRSGSRLHVRSARSDVYLTVQVVPHRFFQLEGEHLSCEVPITPDEAALGAQIEVPTPEGSAPMVMPAGVRSGQSLTLRGKGWPQANGRRGDLIVRVQIVPPRRLSPQERQLYEQLRSQRNFDPRTALRGMRL